MARQKPRRSKRNPLVYLNLIPVVAAFARKHGYAITVHGSLHRDLDLVAVPWRDDACSARSLVLAIAAHLGWFVGANGISDPARKPHGRLGWVLIPPSNRFSHRRACYIDLSVMPRKRLRVVR